jgi:uncharacterized protein (DUF885 family)
MKKTLLTIIVLIIIAIIIYALANYSKSDVNTILDTGDQQVNNIQNINEESEQETQMIDYQVYLVDLVDLEDAGNNGDEIGCNDSIVPVTISEFTNNNQQPIEQAINSLITLASSNNNQEDLYNALENSALAIQNIEINDNTATIALQGDISIAGACDIPRVKAQIEYTATQFPQVNQVQIIINGDNFDDYFSLSWE